MADLKKTIARILPGLFMAAIAAMPAVAGEPHNMVNAGTDKVAIKGYDTVAYFTEGKPIKGTSEFSATWNDTQWYFASSEHRDLFIQDPERYAPQFGGFCSMALTVGKVKDVDPEVWTVVDGKLYLNFSDDFRDKFRKNTAENIKKAEHNWAEVQKQN